MYHLCQFVICQGMWHVFCVVSGIVDIQVLGMPCLSNSFFRDFRGKLQDQAVYVCVNAVQNLLALIGSLQRDWQGSILCSKHHDSWKAMSSSGYCTGVV